MYPKYMVISRKNEDDDLVLLEFDSLEEALYYYDELKMDNVFDCALFRRIHHCYVSL